MVSRDSTEFIRSSESTMSFCVLVAPSTRPVLPPSGTTDWPALLHKRRTAATSSVFAGLTIAAASIGSLRTQVAWRADTSSPIKTALVPTTSRISSMRLGTITLSSDSVDLHTRITRPIHPYAGTQYFVNLNSRRDVRDQSCPQAPCHCKRDQIAGLRFVPT